MTHGAVGGGSWRIRGGALARDEKQGQGLAALRVEGSRRLQRDGVGPRKAGEVGCKPNRWRRRPVGEKTRRWRRSRALVELEVG